MHRRRSFHPLAFAFGLGLFIGAFPLACGSDSVKNPFGPGAGGGGGEAGTQGDAGFRLSVDGGDEVDPTLGGPCEDDGQCDDRVDCTVDRCDTGLGRCRFEPDSASCDDGVYCDGAERCDVRDGCVEGEVVACSDNKTCTIDTCVEQTQSCRHEPRDADGDGDPTRNCGGQDCDDGQPLVNSSAAEVCGNKRDDDCDGEVDEDDCAVPEHDTCKTSLVVTEPGYFDVDFAATSLDYPTNCATKELGFRDIVMTVPVPDGGPFDLDVTAQVDSGHITLTSGDGCGLPDAQGCRPSFAMPTGGNVSRLILRGVGAGIYPIYVASDQETSAQVHVELRAAEPQLGEVCEDAVALTPNGDPVLLRLPDYEADVSSICGPLTGDAFVSFTLDRAYDVALIAEAQKGLGDPVIALFNDNCHSEKTCRRTQPGYLFDRNLGPGSYVVMVSATAPDDVSIRLETSPVTDTPPAEGCDNPEPLAEGVEQLVDLSNHEDAVFDKCLPGAPDATFEFALAKKRDVALVGRFSADGDAGAVSLTSASCNGHIACGNFASPSRAIEHGVAAGTYRAVIESEAGNPVGISRFERDPVAQVYVPFADDCDALVTIPENGGSFAGNTSNLFPDFDGGCDVGGQELGGAPDQMLKLTLSAPRRVIFDMQGSSYETMLSVRQGQFCPGVELPFACAPGYVGGHSFLDLDLQEGDYFVQIDGYNGASGAWKLEVFSAPL